MINNELSNHLNNFFNNRNKKNEAAGNTSSDLMGRLMKNKQNQTAKETGGDAAQAQPSQAGKAPKRRNFVDEYEKSKDPKASQAADTDSVELSAAEKRQAQLKKIMDQLDAEEAARYPGRTDKTDSAKKTETTATSDVVTTSDPKEVSEKEGIGALLNDMPLFNEFKTSLMDAFRKMDSTTAGSISAQYELNYSSMQYIADAAGNFQYQETSFSLKLDINYVKAGAGGMSGSEIADALGKAEDFESFVAALQGVAGQLGSGEQAAAEGGEGQAAASGAANPLEGYLDSNGKPLSAKQLMNNAFKNMSPTDVLNGLQDYFSPEKTAGRIVDFATAFFPMSEAYKKGGDTEESRKEFAEMMRKAVNKGFDQAQGALGAVPKETQSGIDKTHELAMKGFDDFIKNGMNKDKQDNGVYNNLTQFAMSFEMNYSHKSTSVSGYGSRGQAQSTPKASSLNTEA